MTEPLPITDLVFNLDGTLPPEVLAKLPEEVRARLTHPDFIEHARTEIRKARLKDRGLNPTGRRQSSLDPIRFKPAPTQGANRKERRRLQAALRR